ncbi:MAG: bifunctional phosphopantothenoylcysteine decarboxylase/phosphopantothenate--cysteine ligase CoaBC [Cyanobacteria bacterium P01_D01_bin.123]
MEFWRNRRIAIAVCGGIAAYKVCELVSSLAKQEADVRVVLTSGAEKFISPLTFSTLSRQPAYVDADFWNPSVGRPLHIQIADWAEAIAIAPLTANTLGKLAYGLADNLLTNLVLASTCPILLAPAMNTKMWQQASVSQNWEMVRTDDRFWPVAPHAGRLACDAVGTGRMAEPKEIETSLLALCWTRGQQDWSRSKVLVSGGGTREHYDAVRYLGNPASGKMGWAIARAAADRGANVTLISGPLSLSDRDYPKSGFTLVQVTSAAEMRSQLIERFSTADCTFMSAAVSDVRPTLYVSTKIPKSDLPQELSLELVPDIVTELSQQKRSDQTLIGFAAQAGDPVGPATDKLKRKGLDAIAANAIDKSDGGFASDVNEMIWLSRAGDRRTIPLCSKLEVAHHLLDFAKTL